MSVSRRKAECRKLLNPLLVFNLGGEMFYILDQRLRAQRVSQCKAAKVIGDMCERLFAHFCKVWSCDTCSIAELRSVFSEVAHCSIMRLNEESMAKLFDLMLMGLKMQLSRCRLARDLLLCSRNHLDGICALLKAAHCRRVLEVVRKSQRRFDDVYDGASDFTLWTLRRKLLNLLKDRRIKVSLLLRYNLQCPNGYMRTVHSAENSEVLTVDTAAHSTLGSNMYAEHSSDVDDAESEARSKAKHKTMLKTELSVLGALFASGEQMRDCIAAVDLQMDSDSDSAQRKEVEAGNSSAFSGLRAAMDKLQLDDASLIAEHFSEDRSDDDLLALIAD